MPDQPTSIHSAAESRRQWQRVRHLSRWAARRGLRRVVIVLWLGVVVLNVELCLLAEHRSPFAGLSLTFFLFALTSWAMERMGRGLSQPMLEDRAVLTYGEDFDRLKEPQRSEVFDQQVRDHVLGRASEDLRDIDLNTRAQAAAWRMMGSVLLAVFVGLTFLSIAIRSRRHTFDVASIACFAIGVLYLALPTILRLWSEPDPLTDSPLSLVSDHQKE